jgi:hypothetical protein
MWEGRPENAGHRSAVLRAVRAQSMEFSELNVEFGYSRVHTGVHYPGDVVIGSVLGSGTAAMTAAACDRFALSRERIWPAGCPRG